MFRDKNDPKKAHFLQCTPRFLAYFRPSFKNSGFQTCVKTRTKGSLRDPRVEKACFMTKRLGEHDAFWLKQDFKPREQSRLVWRPQSTILFRKNSTVCTIEMQIFPKTGARTIDRPYNFFCDFGVLNGDFFRLGDASLWSVCSKIWSTVGSWSFSCFGHENSRSNGKTLKNMFIFGPQKIKQVFGRFASASSFSWLKTEKFKNFNTFFRVFCWKVFNRKSRPYVRLPIQNFLKTFKKFWKSF